MKETTRVPKATSERPRPAVPGTRPNPNPNLDSFEAVMQAMDAELLRLRQSTAESEPHNPQPTKKDKGKARATPVDVDVDMDIEAAMQAELEGLLEEDDGGSDEGEKPSMDYNLVKNFLESFKSQAGLPGPVGNLAGRLQAGWTLPRDET